MPMLPLAPPLLSTMNWRPSSLVIPSATRRATMSVVPPAAAGTSSVTGRLGYSSAAMAAYGATPRAVIDANRARVVESRRRRDTVILVLPSANVVMFRSSLRRLSTEGFIEHKCFDTKKAQGIQSKKYEVFWNFTALPSDCTKIVQCMLRDNRAYFVALAV